MGKRPHIAVSENHRRGITTALRLLDEALCEFEQYAQGREVRSVFLRERNRLTAGQRKAVLDEIRQMKALLQDIQSALGLDSEERDLRTMIWSRSASLWPVLVETGSRYLRRYGDVPKELGAYLDPRIEELIRHLQALPGLADERRRT